MLPFDIALNSSEPLHQQVTHAVHRAFVSGQLRPGDRFPSVRELSRELKINPNTAHKVVARLKTEGLLVARPGIGTVVVAPPKPPANAALDLRADLEKLVVKALRLGIDYRAVAGALEDEWMRVAAPPEGSSKRSSG
ncbi:MAG: GntR family transcriptional regulator [Acidobacteriota bacterium]